MKKDNFYLFLLFFVVSCSTHKITISECFEKTQIERYDFDVTEGGKESKVILNRGLVTEWRPMTAEGGVCYEYSPASEFYKIIKHYHHNGMIKMRGKILGSVCFGAWEYFDEKGERTHYINEDAKFGAVGPREIIQFLETEGWIDRRNGKNKIYRYKTNLPTNGYFYKELEPNLRIIFRPAIVENGNEIISPQWHIWIVLPIDFVDFGIDEKMSLSYYINGHTGAFDKKGIPDFPFISVARNRYDSFSIDTTLTDRKSTRLNSSH